MLKISREICNRLTEIEFLEILGTMAGICLGTKTNCNAKYRCTVQQRAMQRRPQSKLSMQCNLVLSNEPAPKPPSTRLHSFRPLRPRCATREWHSCSFNTGSSSHFVRHFQGRLPTYPINGADGHAWKRTFQPQLESLRRRIITWVMSTLIRKWTIEHACCLVNFKPKLPWLLQSDEFMFG